MKKILALVLTLVVILSLAACGSTAPAPAATAAPAPATEAPAAEAPAPAEEIPAAEPVKLVVGASSTPHGELLEIVKPALAEQGIDLEIVIYDDYVLPNTALQDGTLDANYFQHAP